MIYIKNEYLEIIGDVLRKYREAKSLSEKEAGRHIHKSQSTIHKYETGTLNIDGSDLLNLIYWYQGRMKTFDDLILGNEKDNGEDGVAESLNDFFRRQIKLCKEEHYGLYGNLLSVHQAAAWLIAEIKDAPIDDAYKDMICETLANNVVLLEMNYPLIAKEMEQSSNLPRSIRRILSDSAKKRKDAFVKYLTRVYNLTRDNMFSLLPMPDDNPYIEVENKEGLKKDGPTREGRSKNGNDLR